METTTITEQAVEAIHRISVRDAQIAPLAKMNREDWLIIGEALSNLRKQHKSDRLYGQAVRDAGLDQGCCSNSVERSNALWMFENAALVKTKAANTALSSPTNIRHYIRGLDFEYTENRLGVHEAILDNTELVHNEEPATTIKVATTEFPPIVVEQPTPPPPPPPKVESEKEKLDRLNVAECFRPGYQKKSTLVAPPEPPKVDPRQWLLNYVRGCSEENLLTLLERVRSIEHPDRGGSHQVSTEVNELIRRIKDDN